MPNLQNTTAATFVESVYRRAEEMARNHFTAPDDDWSPMLFFIDAAGKMNLAAVPMIAGLKDECAAVMSFLLSQRKATSAVLLTSSWMVALPEGTTDIGNVAPSEHPDRREILMIVGVDQDSIVSRTAAILRSADKPPTLGSLEAPEELLGGRMVDALRVGVRRSRREEPA